MAYDGRGNAVVRSAADIPSAAAALGGYETGLYAEEWALFKQVSQIFSVNVVVSCCADSISLPTPLPEDCWHPWT